MEDGRSRREAVVVAAGVSATSIARRGSHPYFSYYNENTISRLMQLFISDTEEQKKRCITFDKSEYIMNIIKN